ncbi:MAG: HAD family phosphatase [Lachnospiraceae bacterium]|jgi:DNA helicase-2/ATP-dependent DNA helicase PcrA|nr:HAD family phosphatase [Lachnospiraceae bacterium]
MIKIVFFDMDGTLIDTEKYFRRFWPKAAAAFGYEMSDGQALSMRSLGRPFAPAQLKEWFGPETDYQAIRAKRTEMMEAQLRIDGLQRKPGAVEILEELKQRGIPAVVVTASPIERTERYLTEVGILQYFDRIISATQVAEGKPSPDVYLLASKEVGFPTEECLAVEDSPNGVMSAYRAGCKVVMVPDQTPADEMLPYLDGVAETLADLGKFV